MIHLLALFAFFYYTPITGIITVFFTSFCFLFYYYFYSKNIIIQMFKSSLIQGEDPFSLNHKILKMSSLLKITPPQIYLSEINFFLLTTYSVSKNNNQIFISNKLLTESSPSILDAYLFLSLSRIKTKNSHKSSLIYLITNIFLKFTRKLDFLFSWIFGIHTNPKYLYRSPFSSLISVVLYSFNFLFLTEKATKKSDQTAVLYCNPYDIQKALWNLKTYSINTNYPLALASSILCVLNPLEKDWWLKYLNYQDNAKERILSISKNYPIF